MATVIPGTNSTGTLTFSAEFNDPNAPLFQSQGGLFNPYIAYYTEQPMRWLSGGAEWEVYSDPSFGDPGDDNNPFRVADGVLTITAKPTPPSLKDDTSQPYMSGLLETSGGPWWLSQADGFWQQYGHWEISAQLPSGQGLWPAFWLVGDNGGATEIDILEALGHEYRTIHHATHDWRGVKDSTGKTVSLPFDPSTGFHTYSLTWTPEELLFKVDGQTTLRLDGANYRDFGEMFLYVNLAVGGPGSWPGAPDATTPFPAEMKVDYIRVYQFDGGTAPPAPTTPPPAPISTTLGSGSDTIVLRISQDAYLGNAQYTVSVDGKQIGGTLTASALKSSGQSDTVTLKGDWAVGTHSVTVNFLNDAWGGTTTTDRNLYVDGMSWNGAAVTGAARMLGTAGPASITATDATPLPGTTPTPTPGGITIGTGSDTIVLRIAQDAYLGNAQYTVSVDGKQIGGTLTASALKSSGQSDTVTLKGDWAVGTHSVTVNFLNDAWGGTTTTDRNLYVDGMSWNGVAVPGAAKVLAVAGPVSIAANDTTPLPVASVAASGSDKLVLRIAQDAYLGNAQYTVSVDGKQIGGTLTASALKSAGQSDTVTLHGNWGAGSHAVTVNFLNDAWGGTATTDRNLYVEGMSWNGTAVSGAVKVLAVAGPVTTTATDATALPAAGTAGSALSATAGTDIFIFSSLAQLPTGGTLASIAGFLAGDRIDLSALDAQPGLAGDQAFAFLGSGAFTRQAGQLHTRMEGTRLLLEGDVNGDGAADFALALPNVASLSASALVL